MCSPNASYVCIYIYILKNLIVQADNKRIVRLYWLTDWLIDNRRRPSQLRQTNLQQKVAQLLL